MEILIGKISQEIFITRIHILSVVITLITIIAIIFREITITSLNRDLIKKIEMSIFSETTTIETIFSVETSKILKTDTTDPTAIIQEILQTMTIRII